MHSFFGRSGVQCAHRWKSPRKHRAAHVTRSTVGCPWTSAGRPTDAGQIGMSATDPVELRQKEDVPNSSKSLGVREDVRWTPREGHPARKCLATRKNGRSGRWREPCSTVRDGSAPPPFRPVSGHFHPSRGFFVRLCGDPFGARCALPRPREHPQAIIGFRSHAEARSGERRDRKAHGCFAAGAPGNAGRGGHCMGARGGDRLRSTHWSPSDPAGRWKALS